MMSLLSRWVRPRPKVDASHLEVTVYTRSQCCCCHKALDLLGEYQGRYGFSIREVDVDDRPGAGRAVRLDGPRGGGRREGRFKGVVNPVLLERLLVAESRGGR